MIGTCSWMTGIWQDWQLCLSLYSLCSHSWYGICSGNSPITLPPGPSALVYSVWHVAHNSDLRMWSFFVGLVAFRRSPHDPGLPLLDFVGTILRAVVVGVRRVHHESAVEALAGTKLLLADLMAYGARDAVLGLAPVLFVTGRKAGAKRPRPSFRRGAPRSA